MDPRYYDQAYFGSPYQHAPDISVTNYGPATAGYVAGGVPNSASNAAVCSTQQRINPQHGSGLLTASDGKDDPSLDLTIKVFSGGSAGKTYVVRDVQVGTISSNEGFKQFAVDEFGKDVCGEAKDMEIGYYKGNKRVWIRTNDDYVSVLGKLREGCSLTLWCEPGAKPRGRRRPSDQAESDSDSDEPPKRCSSVSGKRRKTSLQEERDARVQEMFEKIKAKHGDKFTGPQYRLWAEAIEVGQHSSYEEPPQGSFFGMLQGRAHGVRKSGSSDVLASAVTSLASSLAAAIEPRRPSSAAGSSTPPHPSSGNRTTSIIPVRAAQLKSTYISQIKGVHSLLEVGALTDEQYKTQRDLILQQMDGLTP